ncbi:MAG: restriction endonuclease subunit S [Deltaproteobacteria bacterium]|nr:restriction endonuclease subunit S [Deltaproteobacteria bacterium]MBU51286.1 restriction endonuclease subunit S [Deltaproteobacteria bacterium]
MEDIPLGWDSIPVGRIYRRVKRTNVPHEELLSVYRDHGVVPKKSRDDNFNKPSEDLSPYQLVCPENLVMNKMKAWQGSIAISCYRGIVSPAYFVYEKIKKVQCTRIKSKYIHYLLRSPIYITQYMSRSKGIRVNQWDLDPKAFEQIELLLPSPYEQTQIAKFLDYETAKIDALIEKQQQLIQLLQEKRQAVISHAVTKGLNPDAPMRDSGIPWIGEIPAHWKIKKLGHFGQLQNGLNISGDSFGSGFPFISYGDVYKNQFIPSNPSGLVRSTKEDQKKYSIERGDVFFTRTSETVDDIGIASTCLQRVEDATFAGFLIRFRPWSDDLDPVYSSFLFRNKLIQSSFTEKMNLVTRASLSQNTLKTLSVCIPPQREQAQIATHLQKQHSNFEKLARDLTQQTKLLQERRTALISAAVTGKIDVRDWQPPTHTEEEAS